MRVLVVSDIHGNVEALRAVVGRGADGVLSAVRGFVAGWRARGLEWQHAGARGQGGPAVG